MQNNIFQVVHQATTNGMGKTKPRTSKNQDHPLLNYLSENTSFKLKNNFMLVVEKLEQKHLNQGGLNSFQSLKLGPTILVGHLHTC
jgi:hypothetical protein